MNRTRPWLSVALIMAGTVSMTCASRSLEIAQRFLARALGILEFLREVFGACGELNLLLAQLQ